MLSNSNYRSLSLAITAFLLLLSSSLFAQSPLNATGTGSEQERNCLGEQCGDTQAPVLHRGDASQLSVPESRPRIQKRDQADSEVDSGRSQKSGMLPTIKFPPLAPTEFQEFVKSSIGRKLPIYGLSLFDQVPTTFAPIDRVPVTADYVIGPGDELLIRAWGQIDVDARLVVDRTGEIYLPKVGSIPVAGIKYEQVHDRIKSAIGRVFRNFDVSVNVGQLRSIQIFIVGQARRPGSYTVSSLSTLVNALFVSGGPAPSGSMRHIQLKRNDNVVTEFDFYDLLLKGDKSRDVRLLPGDVIYIPPVGAQVALAGSVNVPAIYELRNRSNSVVIASASDNSGSPFSGGNAAAIKLSGTTLGDAIEMAGGLSSTADGQKAVVERIDNHSIRKVEEFPLGGGGLERELKDGDLVRILSVSPKFENAVTLRGNVARPGRYEWHEGMRIQDLIPDRRELVPREFWNAANSVTRNVDLPEIGRDASLKDGSHSGLDRRDARLISSDTEGLRRGDDYIDDYSGELAATSSSSDINRLANRRDPEVGGDENDRVEKKRTTAKLRNEIKHNVPEVNWDYAVVQRLNPDDLSIRLVSFNLAKAVIDKDPENNVVLEPNDIVTIFAKSDLGTSLEKQTKFVRLEGELNAGVYRVEAGETLRHLVARAGGLTPNAYLFGAEFTRESVREEQQKGLDEMIESIEKQTLESATAVSLGDDKNEKAAEIAAQKELLNKLREVKPTGRIVLEVKPDSSGVNSLPDISLEDGDRLMVPHRPSAVAVMGAVYNKSSFLYHPNTSLAKYLQSAGGPTREADKGRIFVVRANGSVISKQSVSHLWSGNFEALRLLPGDAIIVPEKIDRGAGRRVLRDWAQIVASIAMPIAIIEH